MTASRQVHATAILAGGRGVLIEGPPGAGKSTLARALIGAARAQGRHAALVSDDRVDIRAVNGRLVASAPAAIAGLIEVAGLGIVPAGEPCRAVIDLVIALVAPEAVERIPEPGRAGIAGVRTPLLAVPRRDAPAALMIASAHPLLAGILGTAPHPSSDDAHISLVFRAGGDKVRARAGA